MSTLLWAATSSATTSGPRELAAAAIAGHLASAYWKKWLASNPRLGPLVDAYLHGGPRPTSAQIGSNHYGLALVLTEDIHRG